MGIKIKVKGPFVSLLGAAVGSSDEGRPINEMLFKDLTSHSLMPAMWVRQHLLRDNLRAAGFSF